MKKIENKVKISNFSLLLAVLIILILVARLAQLTLSSKVDGINLKELESSRTTKKEIIESKRGTIFDCNNNILAQDVSSYTLIAYLDPSRTIDEDDPKHVVDKQKTASVISTLLDIDYKTVLGYLNKTNVYQTEFGPKGKGLNEITKDKILEANLPGIDFIETVKRYYPYGNFSSYLIGYAKKGEEGITKGELGLEKKLNEELTGTDGYREYIKDKNGYKIAGTNEIVENSKDGSSVYLTIDSNVEFFVEQAMDTYLKDWDYDSMSIIVAEAKTGKILAYASNPGFDPNIRNIKNYLDPISEIAFEPGSTMKIFTYMSTLESGKYKGSDTFLSGSYKTKDGTIISDWNKVGWGYINFDTGFKYSSNVGCINLIKRYLNPTYFKNYLLTMGFGSKTGVGSNLEARGKIDFTYETEIANSSFGQGITATPIQYIQALTSIVNDGTVLVPYVIDRIEDYDGKITYQGQRTEKVKVASTETVEYIKNLMWHAVNDSDAVASDYKIKGYDLMGKSGTAQIARTNGRGYYDGDKYLNRSIALMFPKKDPQIIIYGVLKLCESTKPLSRTVKKIVKDISKYYNIYSNVENNDLEIKYDIESYINKNVSKVENDLIDNNIEAIVLGNGKTIINQYPIKGTVTIYDKVFVVTNSETFIMPDLTGYSKREVETLQKLLDLEITIKGNGYVKEQSIEPGTEIKRGEIIEVSLNLLYTKEQKK